MIKIKLKNRYVLKPNSKIITEFKVLPKEFFHVLNYHFAVVRVYTEVHFPHFLIFTT